MTDPPAKSGAGAAAFGLAKTAAAAVAPEVVVPLELAGKAIDLVGRRRAPAEPASGEPVLVQEAEGSLLSLGKDKVRVRVIKGVRVVQVERAAKLSVKELAEILIAGGFVYALYEIDQYAKQKGSISKNALGIPFGNWFPGGGSDPLNYL